MSLLSFKNSLASYTKPALFIFLILLIASSAFIFLKKSSKNSGEKPAPVENQVRIIPQKENIEKLPQDVKDIRKQIIAKQIEDRKGDLVLFQSKEYNIVFVPSAEIFFVQISSDPANQYRQEAQKWFLDFGLTQTDLCTLPVRFILDFNLKQTNPDFSLLPDGCSIEKGPKP